MTKSEWLASRDGPQMLVRVPGEQFTPRKHLLLACGCVRYHLDREPPAALGPGAGIYAPAADLPGWLAGAEAAADGNPSVREQYAASLPGQKAHWWLPSDALARVVRDLFAFPFEPAPVRDEWLTATVVAVAEAIDSQGSFEDMPVLGDALEDAGCTDEDVLNHCRHESCHFRGCWLLDAILRRQTGSWRDLYRAADRAAAAEVPPEKVAALLRPGAEFPFGPFLVGTEEAGYAIAAWHPEHGVCTLRSADNPLYFALTERLIADEAPRFVSPGEADAHARGR